MIRLFMKSAVAAALVGVALQGDVQSAPPTSSKKKAPPTELPTKPTTGKPEPPANAEIVILKEQGKQDRKCAIITSTPRQDGTVVHQVKALDNGEIMTIIEPKSSGTATMPAPTPKPEKAAVSIPTPKPEPVKPMVKETPAPTKTTTLKPAPTATKSDVPSAMNPPKAIESKVSELPKGVQFPNVPAPKGVATIGEPAPISTAEPAMLPVSRIPPEKVSPTPVTQVTQLREMLTEALQPSHREAAAEGLILTPQGKSREVRNLLCHSAQNDPSATVRMTCLRCLAKQGMVDEFLQTAIANAQKDTDSRVRSEAKAIMQAMR